jgi:CubicO group peptidase (beta-lactamase class C family)
MAVEEGKLKESDLVEKYVPELEKASAFADATFGQVLDMTNSTPQATFFSILSDGVLEVSNDTKWVLVKLDSRHDVR